MNQQECRHPLHRHVAEQIRHRLSIVRSAYGLGQDHGNIHTLQQHQQKLTIHLHGII